MHRRTQRQYGCALVFSWEAAHNYFQPPIMESRIGSRRAIERAFTPVLYLPIFFALLISACSPSGSNTPQASAETQINLPSETSAPLATLEPTLAPTLALEGTTPPEGVTQQDGRWFFQDREVILTSHANEDGSTSNWLSFSESPDWPLFIQNADGSWRLGVEAWTATIAVINTNDVPLDITVAQSAPNSDEEPQEQTLAPYEIFTLPSVPPGSYELVFSFNSGTPIDLNCEIRVEADSRYQFFVISDAIAVLEAGFDAQSASDVNLLTSPLCGS